MCSILGGGIRQKLIASCHISVGNNELLLQEHQTTTKNKALPLKGDLYNLKFTICKHAMSGVYCMLYNHLRMLLY